MNVILLGSQFLTENSNGNFKRTVLGQVYLETFAEEFNDADKQRMQNSNISINQAYSMWAVNQRFKNMFKQINVGDIVLFYSMSKYHHCAKVKYVFEGQYPNIAEELWSNDKYEQLFIIEELVEINYSREVIHEKMGEKIDNKIINGIKIASAPNWDFVNNLLTKPVKNNTNEHSVKQYGSISGDSGTSDRIAEVDHLSRATLIEKVAQFYIEFTQQYDSGNKNLNKEEKKEQLKPQLFLGIFGKWGKGKSSFVSLLHKEIKKQTNSHLDKETQTYILANIDCSLVDQKETLWLNIINKIIEELEEKRKDGNNRDTDTKNPFKWITRTKFFDVSHFQIKFNNLNVLKVLWAKKILTFFYIILIVLSANFLLLNPPTEFKFDLKNIGGILTLGTLIITVIKTFDFRLGQILLPNKHTQVTSSYFKSQDEFKQLLQITENSLQKNQKLRILITLDEIDRMNKSLLPELMECLQLFKAIEQPERVSLQFIFSFNHDIVFPNIGKSLTMNDPYLLVNSLSEPFLSRDTVYGTTRTNSYQLGKEYMDKYLDISIYLNNIESYSDMVDNIFEVEQVSTQDDQYMSNLELEKEKYASQDIDTSNSSVKEDNASDSATSNSTIVSSFTDEEIKFIKASIDKNKEHIEPRKLHRLKNALILIKNVDLDTKDLSVESEEELEMFVSEFLKDHDDFIEGKTGLRNTYKILKSAHYFLDKRPVLQQTVENQIQYPTDIMYFSMNKSKDSQIEHN